MAFNEPDIRRQNFSTLYRAFILFKIVKLSSQLRPGQDILKSKLYQPKRLNNTHFLPLVDVNKSGMSIIKFVKAEYSCFRLSKSIANFNPSYTGFVWKNPLWFYPAGLIRINPLAKSQKNPPEGGFF